MPGVILQRRQTIWTSHSRMKMRFYALSESRIIRAIRNPERVEEGIAPNTVAVMQRVGSLKNPWELWVMLQDEKDKRKIISAWRYPGTTKAGAPLPRAILSEIQMAIEA